MCGLEDDDVSVVVLALVVVVAVRQQVSLFVESAWFVMENKVVFRRFGHPARLSSVQLLRLSEILEVLMIRPDFEIYGGAHQVVAPFVER